LKNSRLSQALMSFSDNDSGSTILSTGGNPNPK